MRKASVLFFIFLIAACSSKPLPPEPISEIKDWNGEVSSETQSRYRPVVGTRGMVVSDDVVASEWGAEILRRGGNAVDAAVATAFALSVTRPHYASLGGGGFLLYCPKPGQSGAKPCTSVDYREQAPGAATRDLFIRDGKARPDLAQNGALASGTPGVVAGLLTALEKFGTMRREVVLLRPIELARSGIVWSAREESGALARWEVFNPEAKKLFGHALGERVKQVDLAKVLREVSENGIEGFYQGWVAEKIVKGIRAGGGILSEKDFLSYRARIRAPLSAHALGMEVVSMAPPSSGGGVLLELLGFAEKADREGEFSEGPGSVTTIHALVHAMALGFADRAKYYGDPDAGAVPMEQLLSKEYLDRRWADFHPGKAVLPESAGEFSWHEGNHTTHLSVIDREGSAVSLTTTINESFGSGFVPPGTGIVMNNEMDDFSTQPGVPNEFGLIGGEANSVGPYKRPLSSMTPTIVRDEKGGARIVIGAEGGPRIITSVFLTLMNRLRFGMSLPDAVEYPRFHQQWKPAEIMLEKSGFPAEIKKALAQLGYSLREITGSGAQHALEKFPNGRVWGAADHRAEGLAIAE